MPRFRIPSIALCATLAFLAATPAARAQECFDEAVFHLQDALFGKSMPWFLSPGMSARIQGYRIRGGVLLDGNESSIVLTAHWFKQAGLPIPKDAEPVDLIVYRYSPPLSSNPQNRGGGRDHILLESAPVSLKGSGTNEFFSGVNSAFELGNFRSNGLQKAAETIEYTLARVFEAVGIPVEKHLGLELLPLSSQPVYAKTKDAGDLAVQTRRLLSSGRESQLPAGTQPKESERIELAARLFLHNIGHGAVNPENLTANGKVLDLGHVTFGIPYLSGVYRCTECTFNQGWSGDGTLMNILDHYFRKPVTKREKSFRERGRVYANAYNGSLNAAQSKAFLHSVLSSLDIEPKPFSLSASEIGALEDLLMERIPIVSGIDAGTKRASRLHTTKKTIEDSWLPDSQAEETAQRDPWGAPTSGEGDSPWVSSDQDPWNPADDEVSETSSNQNPWWGPTTQWSQWWASSDQTTVQEEIYVRVQKHAHDLLGIDPAWQTLEYRPYRISVSLRTLLQLAALKKWDPVKAAALQEAFLRIVWPAKHDSFRSAIRLFENLYQANGLKLEDLLPLFDHYLPSYAMRSELEKNLSKIKKPEDAAAVLRKLIAGWKKPRSVTPERFHEITSRMIRSIEDIRFVEKKKKGK